MSTSPKQTAPKKLTLGENFRHFFFRGLGILLPSILTIGILIWAYGFVTSKIAEPINSGIRTLIVSYSPWPKVSQDEIETYVALIEDARGRDTEFGAEFKAWKNADFDRGWLVPGAKRYLVRDWWNSYRPYTDWIGLIVAVVAIYMAGAFLGSYIGKRIVARGEELFRRLPLIRQVYPAVKQVTEFLVGNGDAENKIKFSKVVAVQYPRKGIWSVGLLTGDTMRSIQEAAGEPCVTVFIPSSPTPFTGYVITVPRVEAKELDVSIEEVLQFTVSGGVVVPTSQIVAGPTLWSEDGKIASDTKPPPANPDLANPDPANLDPANPDTDPGTASGPTLAGADTDTMNPKQGRPVSTDKL